MEASVKIINYKEFNLFQPEILKSYKVYPRIQKLDYLKHKFYLYVYLDPFKNFGDDNKILKVQIQQIQQFCTFYFEYAPWYIGKASSRRGYRLNQHLNNFLNKKSIFNKYKRQYFEYLDKKMKENKDPRYPHNWEEYKNLFIIPLKEFDTEEELLQCEMALINVLKTKEQDPYNGYLVNQITKYNQRIYRNKQDFIS